MRTAIFDLDGTLADTSADLIAAANGTLAEAGIGGQLDPHLDRAVAFAGGRAMLRAGLERIGPTDETAVARLFPRFIEIYGAALAVHTRLYDGVEDALTRLDTEGWRLAVCTNKPVALARLLLDALHVRHRFAALLGADSLPVRKPDPRHLLETIAQAGGDPSSAVLVGDSVTDRDTATAARIPCVLVGFGTAGADVGVLRPEAIVEHFKDLPAVLDRLVPAVPAVRPSASGR